MAGGRNAERMTHDADATRNGRVENAGRTAHNETGNGGMETQGELRTTGRKARRTARKSWAAGAQLSVKSGRTERERRASSAQRNGRRERRGGKGQSSDRGGGKYYASGPQQQTQPNKLAVAPEQF